jgi:predicted short-subunit dehydrogenase-like oxidoreductase (DUF2520 family)
MEITQVHSRTFERAEILAAENGAKAVRSAADLARSDFIVLSVPDSAIESVAASLPKYDDCTVLHVSGSTSADILRPHCKKYGVLYPLQTFSASKPVADFRNIPVFVEADSEETLREVKKLAEAVSARVSVSTSEKRMAIHAAAVFACNFLNLMLRCGFEICREFDADPAILQPLVLETIGKALESGSPEAMQTGPAARGDCITIAKHVNLLRNSPALASLYVALSDYIAGNARK